MVSGAKPTMGLDQMMQKKQDLEKDLQKPTSQGSGWWCLLSLEVLCEGEFTVEVGSGACLVLSIEQIYLRLPRHISSVLAP